MAFCYYFSNYSRINFGFRCPVIRKIISKSSKYFEALLGPDFREGTENVIVLPNVDGPTLKAIICYIYAGFIELTEDNIATILAAASGMELISLEEKCEKYLEENLSKDNCVAILMLADTYAFGQLKMKALTEVCAHFEYIPMADILSMEGNSFNEILKCDKIKIPETKIFEYLVEWVRKNETERAKFVPVCLKSIRLEFMPKEVIEQIVILDESCKCSV